MFISSLNRPKTGMQELINVEREQFLRQVLQGELMSRAMHHNMKSRVYSSQIKFKKKHRAGRVGKQDPTVLLHVKHYFPFQEKHYFHKNQNGYTLFLIPKHCRTY